MIRWANKASQGRETPRIGSPKAEFLFYPGETEHDFGGRIVLVDVFKSEIPPGGAGAVLPDCLKNLPVILERDLLAEVRSNLVESKKMGPHPDHGLAFFQLLQDDLIPDQVGLLPAQVEDERPGRLDKRHPDPGGKEISVPIPEEIEGKNPFLCPWPGG